MRQRFRKGFAGDLTFIPREGPTTSSASVTLYTPGNAELTPSVTVTLPTVATTLNIFSGYEAGVDFLSLLATTNVVPKGFYYLGTESADNVELVQVRDVVTNAVWLTRPTERPHMNGEDFRGAELIAPLTSAHTATKDTVYQAEWVYEVGGVTHRASTVWDVVARIFRLPTMPADLRRGISDSLLRSLQRSYSLDDAIDESERMVIDAIERDGRRPDLVRDPDQFRTMGVLGVRLLALRKIADVEEVQEPSSLTRAQREFDQEYGRIAAGGLTWYDSDDDAAADDSEEGTQVGYYMQLG